MSNTAEELARLAALRDQGVLSEEEFQQQKARVLNGDSPPPAEKPKASRKAAIGCLVVVGILLLLLVIGALAGGSDSSGNETATASAPAAAPTEVTATELFRAYEANEAAAQQRYGGRPLLVTGVVNGVDLDFSDDPVVQLRTSNQFMQASARLTEASKPQASSLARGQSIVLLCQSVTEVMAMPQLGDCVIQA